MPQAGAEDRLAFSVFNALANGMGGIDWSGLPMVCGWLGVEDMEGLMQRLTLIKAHRKADTKE
mgnify:FL=1